MKIRSLEEITAMFEKFYKESPFAPLNTFSKERNKIAMEGSYKMGYIDGRQEVLEMVTGKLDSIEEKLK